MDYRVRSRGGYTPAPKLNEFYTDGGPAHTCGTGMRAFGFAYETCGEGTLETMSDMVTKNFSARRKSGELIFNPMVHTKRTSRIDKVGTGYILKSTTPTCNVLGANFYQVVDYEGSMLAFLLVGINGVSGVPLPMGSAIISNEDCSRLQTEISTKVLANRGQSKDNLWESTFEYKQTLALFSGPLKSLFRFFRKNRKNMRRMTPSEAWLTYRYGIKPFVNDMTAIVEGLSLPVGVRRETTRAREEIQEREVSVSTVGTSVAVVKVGTLKTDVYVVRGMSIDDHFATLKDNLGFSAKGLLTVPWDLIPFSFVLDWFVSLGDFLKAYSPTPGYLSLGSCLTTERTITTEYTAISTVGTGAGGTQILAECTGTCSSISWEKTRMPLGAPGVVVRSDFRFSSLTRVADTVALLSVLASSFFSSGPLPKIRT